jgi:predicted Zn-dependent protease
MRLAHNPLLLFACAVGPVLSGCSSAQSRAAEAYAEYQSAYAANNLPAAKQALLELVSAQDDNPESWTALGRLHATLGEYSQAYYAFTRAHELDRSNPEILRALTQLALSGGDFREAEKQGRDLEIVAPGDPWVRIARGYLAVAERRFGDASGIANSLLKDTPRDPVAIGLKARALVGLNEQDQAVSLLQEQVRENPADVSSLQLLSTLYQIRGNWPGVESAARSLSAQKKGDAAPALLLVEAAFRSGDEPQARKTSFDLLERHDLQLTRKVLELWKYSSDQKARSTEAFALGMAAADPSERLAFAEFLVGSGRASQALQLAGTAQFPVTARNAQANAVIGSALVSAGTLPPALRVLNAVLEYDGGNPTALEGRAKLWLRASDPVKAVPDAQKLVAVQPQSPEARLLLARCFEAAGMNDAAQRALWDAFHDIPADESVLNALVAALRAQPDAVRSIKLEFATKREAQLNENVI